MHLELFIVFVPGFFRVGKQPGSWSYYVISGLYIDKRIETVSLNKKIYFKQI